MDTKAELRRRLRQARDALIPADRQRFSRQICSHLLALPWLSSTRRVALYASFGSEADTQAVFSALRQRGIACCYPRVLPAHGMEFVDVAHPDSFVVGSYGIRESTGQPVALAEIDLIVVPGLGFDTQGTRLGYGAGYYDRALARYAGICVGVGYAQQMLQALPADPHDRPMDVMVTQDGCIATSERGRQKFEATRLEGLRD